MALDHLASMRPQPSKLFLPTSPRCGIFDLVMKKGLSIMDSYPACAHGSLDFESARVSALVSELGKCLKVFTGSFM